ncbi:MAG: PD-(D/E)XK motif protein [Cytophagaceae bacterium]|nr:PD-(D/E)XK motif protein [Cytophagaceae bacterium]
MTPLPERWQYLENGAGELSGFRRIRFSDDSPGEVFLGFKTPERHRILSLELPLPLAAGLTNLPKYQGLRVEKVADPQRTDVFLLNLVLTEPTFADVFDVLLADLIPALLPLNLPREVLRVFLDRLTRWQALFGRFAPEGLSPEQQRGLYGELLVLRKLLNHQTDARYVVESWVGPTGAAQDFQSGDWALEVKTSTATSPQRFLVNGEAQLDEAGRAALFLFFLHLDTRPHNPDTLNSLVATLRQQLAGDAGAILLFGDKLLTAGYFDAQAGPYAETGYAIRSETCFWVRGAFPRLTRRTLPVGVSEACYAVSLAGCQPFVCSETEFFNNLAPR